MLEPHAPLTVGIDGTEIPEALTAAPLSRLAMPLVARSAGDRLAVVASAALWRIGERLVVSTAAHLFDAGLQLGDLGVPDTEARRVWWFGARGAQLRIDAESDVAVIMLRQAEDFPRCWHGLPRSLLGEPPADSDAFVLAGWPSEQTRWTGERLVARPVVCLTRAHEPHGHTYRYRRVADRPDGVSVYTPALEGASGALLWRLSRADAWCVLQPAGMQVSFVHGSYLRCAPLSRVAALLG